MGVVVSSLQAMTREFELAFAAMWRRSDQIFEMLPPGGLHARPIGLRHPFLFYLGHLPAFSWNQVGRGVLGEGAHHADFDLLFERGIDPADADGAKAASRARWPGLEEVEAYRDEVRAAVLARIPEVLARSEDLLCERGRVLNLVIEHELMHHETLLYMMSELPRDEEAPAALTAGAEGEGRAAEARPVLGGRVRLGVDFEAVDFGWDNEFGREEVEVAPFLLDSLPVRNRDYLDYLRGHPASRQAALWPAAWVPGPGAPRVKTVLGQVAFERAAGWPVQLSGALAQTFAAWRGGRLATEAELRMAIHGGPDGRWRAHPWGEAAPAAHLGNFGFQRFTPTPVGSHPAGASAWGIEELVGNGWEWTGSSFRPLPGFQAYAHTYPGYSADFFDDAHDVVLGGSWATDVQLLRPGFRNWYRRDYPYVFSSMRVLRLPEG